MRAVRHVGPELLAEMAENGRQQNQVLLCELVNHLAEHCPACLAGRDALRPKTLPPKADTEDLLPYRPIVARVVRKLARIARLSAGEPKTALGLVAEFLDRSAEDRWTAVFESRRLLSPRVIAHLLAYASQDASSCGDSPEELTRLALALVDRLELAQLNAASTTPVLVPNTLIEDLRADCWALLARELLAAGAQGGADFVLRSAEELLRQGTGDPLVALRVAQVRAFWYWKAGRRGDALRVLKSLERQARGLRQTREHAELLLWQSQIAAATGDAAAEALQQQGILRLAEGQGTELLAWIRTLRARLGLN